MTVCNDIRASASRNSESNGSRNNTKTMCSTPTPLPLLTEYFSIILLFHSFSMREFFIVRPCSQFHWAVILAIKQSFDDARMFRHQFGCSIILLLLLFFFGISPEGDLLTSIYQASSCSILCTSDRFYYRLNREEHQPNTQTHKRIHRHLKCIPISF